MRVSESPQVMDEFLLVSRVNLFAGANLGSVLLQNIAMRAAL